MLFQGLVGLSEAMYLWLVAAGLSLIFGVLRVLNFAHGSLYMLDLQKDIVRTVHITASEKEVLKEILDE